MSLKLFIDFETTGLPDFNKRARDPAQPHIVQLAAILEDDDGNELESHNVMIQPDGWEIPKEVSDIHGITTELARHGIPEISASVILLSMIRKATCIVAHNITFDKFIARIAMRRYELMTDADDQWWKQLPTFCTMRATTELCKLPGPFAGKFKWPKLQEAHQHAFGETFEDAHDALADVRACARIYRWLKAQKPVEEVRP